MTHMEFTTAAAAEAELAEGAVPMYVVRFAKIGGILDGAEFTLTLRPGSLQAMGAEASREITRLATDLTGGAFMEVWYWPNGDLPLAGLDGTTGRVLDGFGRTAGQFTVIAAPADNGLDGFCLDTPVDPAAAARVNELVERLDSEPDLVGELGGPPVDHSGLRQAAGRPSIIEILARATRVAARILQAADGLPDVVTASVSYDFPQGVAEIKLQLSPSREDLVAWTAVEAWARYFAVPAQLGEIRESSLGDFRRISAATICEGIAVAAWSNVRADFAPEGSAAE